MIFPKYIKKGDTIGVTATSSGIVNELKQKRMQLRILKTEDTMLRLLTMYIRLTGEDVARQEKKEESSLMNL